MDQQEKESNKGRRGEDQKNGLEWAVFGVSLLLVLGVLGFWGYQVFADEPTPPDLYVETWPAPASNNPYRYRVVVTNKGGETAENAKIEVALEQNDGEVLDKAELEFPFLPKGSEREGWVIFKENPAEADTVIARVVSFKKP